MTNVCLKGFVLLAENVAASREFYEILLGQEVEMDINGINVAFKGGLTLWQKAYAHNLLFTKVLDTPKEKHDTELYFETANIDEIFENLQKSNVKVLHPIIEQPWMQKCFRVYDPDNFIVEIAESMPDVIIRLYKSDMPTNEIIAKTMMPKEIVEAIVASI